MYDSVEHLGFCGRCDRGRYVLWPIWSLPNETAFFVGLCIIYRYFQQQKKFNITSWRRLLPYEQLFMHVVAIKCFLLPISVASVSV